MTVKLKFKKIFHEYKISVSMYVLKNRKLKFSVVYYKNTKKYMVEHWHKTFKSPNDIKRYLKKKYKCSARNIQGYAKTK